MRRIGLLLVAGIVVAAVAATPGVAAKKFHKFFPGHKVVQVGYTFNGSTWLCYVQHRDTGQYPGNATSGGFDREFCDDIPGSVGYIPGTYSGSPIGAFPPFGTFGWFSDWPDLNHEQASNWTVTITDNDDGTVGLEAIAFYPLIP